MIDRVLRDDRARLAARKARTCYAWASVIWMVALACFGLYLLAR